MLTSRPALWGRGWRVSCVASWVLWRQRRRTHACKHAEVTDVQTRRSPPTQEVRVRKGGGAAAGGCVGRVGGGSGSSWHSDESDDQHMTTTGTTTRTTTTVAGARASTARDWIQKLRGLLGHSE